MVSSIIHNVVLVSLRSSLMSMCETSHYALCNRLDYHCTAGLSRCKPLGTAQPVVAPPGSTASANTPDTAAGAAAGAAAANANAGFGIDDAFKAPAEQYQQDTAVTAAVDSQVC
jgi:hypothetical protein